MKQKTYINLTTGKGPFWIENGGLRKNIILITVDMVPPQFYLDGNYPIHTPNIDMLKNTGVFFTNAFSTSPLCGPSRASYLTGRYSYITGNSERSHDGHATELRKDDIIWPEYLKAVGYHTRHSGKSHVGIEKFMEVFSENDSPWHRWSPPWYDDEGYLKFLRKKGLKPITFKREIKGISWSGKERGNSYGGWIADQHGEPFPEEATYPSYLVERAISSIESWLVSQRNRNNGNSLLYFQLDFFGPHQPFAIPGGLEAREKSIRERIKIPESWLEWQKSGFKELEGQPRVYGMYRKNWGIKERDTLMDYMVANQLQFELIDRMIGKFFNYLKENKIFDDSLIVFIADHGEMNGEWGCIDKGAYLNPQVLRVPIIIRLPSGSSSNTQLRQLSRGTVCKTPVSLLDIFPTVMEFAGVEVPERADGVSLFAMAMGEKRPQDKPIMFDVWNHVVPNPSVGTIFKASDTNYYMFTYNATDEIDELYKVSKYSVLKNLSNGKDKGKYNDIYIEGIKTLNRYLSLDPRWEVYRGYLQLEYAEMLELLPADTQKFI